MGLRTLHHTTPMGKAIFAPSSPPALAASTHALPIRAAATLLCLAICAAPGEAAVLRVPQDFPKIGDALAASVPTDTVLVESGTYSESLVMRSGVVLRGAWAANPPVVSPQGQGVGLLAVDCDASTRVEDFVFIGGMGSGFGGGMSISASFMTVVHCSFVNNQAPHGGGVGGDGAAFTLQECTFENNHATQSGGAIAITDQPSPTITGCRFKNNSALAGGAIAVRNGCEPTITLSILESNAADQGAAVWYDFFAGGTLQGCTIAFNTGPALMAGSVHFGGFSNTFVSHNIVAFSSITAGYFFVPGSNPILGCNDAFGNEGGDAITGGTDLGTNFSLDPLFCDAAGGNYALDPNSPCVGGPCGLVGALDVGPCGGTPVPELTASSWGAIKNRYR